METIKNGIHPDADRRISGDFDRDEKQIIKRWADLWFITLAGKKLVGKSEYKYAYAKPIPSMEEGTGISKELVIVFSPYEMFDSRSFKAYDSIVASDIDQRYEKLCYVLISKDPEIENKVKEFRSGQEYQVIVPFSYDDFHQHKTDSYFIRNRLRKYFFARDLFDYSEPLKRDTFFFGRNDIVTTIITKHLHGLNMGVFGLRKTGKTSIIYDVIRKSNDQKFIAANIDCQNPSFNQRRWYEALYYVIEQVVMAAGLDIKISESEFDEIHAADKFDLLINRIHNQSKKTVLLLFDEIENITYEKSPSEHWCSGLDFVYFWQSIRSSYQRYENTFTFCLFGTNPKCVEMATIHGKDNPIFNMINPTYIAGFSVPQTREMVRKLGRIMGIQFNETIYGKLVEDYGGHPFLIRRVCSKIAQLYPERPVEIDRIRYSKAKEAFNLENTYFDMILNVLTQFYSDEYEMLKLLATKDFDNFRYFVKEDPSMVTHLIGYGLISNNDGKYDFKIDAIKEYIIRLNNAHIKPVTAVEKWEVLSKQRNEIETDLRKMVRNIIRTVFASESDAKQFVVSKVLKNEKKLLAYTYKDLFDSRKSEIYLKGLTDLINSQWKYFADYMGKQEVFINHMNVLNAEGRFDAHATVPNDSEIGAVDNAIRYLKEAINNYNESMS